jgi:magnesium-protoporphyrin O-methyltransferase
LIVKYLEEDGLSSHSILELGCGVGGVCLELIGKGASSATGIDISPEMISTARKLSELKGYSEKTSFVVGDAAKLPLPSSHIVILDRVVCCYPDAEMLLSNSLAGCLATYVISYPRDDGLWRFLIPVVSSIVKGVVRLTGSKPFFFLHNTAKLREYVNLRGFHEVFMKSMGPWSLLIYKKT